MKIKSDKIDQPIAIQLTDITKSYELHHEKPTFTDKFAKRKSRNKFTALKNLNLTVHQGETIGIIGPNGTGKTTLLKIVAGITKPDSGSVSIHGRLVSLIDLEAGFHPDLTGEENIYLNGLIIGMTKKEINKQIKKIVDYAGIGDFIDTPLYTYSSGMKLRLGFSVAVHSNPDILIIDENIVVGDKFFQKKVSKYLNNFFKKNKTAIVVSHWTDLLEKMCTKIIDIRSIKSD